MKIIYIICNISSLWCRPCNSIKNELINYIEKIDNNNYIFCRLNYDIVIKDDRFNEYIIITKIPYFYFIQNKNIENQLISSELCNIKEFINNYIDNFELNIDF